jgi:hypothetical protein
MRANFPPIPITTTSQLFIPACADFHPHSSQTINPSTDVLSDIG